jgi:glucose/arabinose dehydrogenase
MRPRYRLPLALLAGAALVLSGCAKFDDSAAGQTYSPAPELTPQQGPQPSLPEVGGEGPGGSRSPAPPTQTSVPPPQGCKDFDRMVIATCLDTVDAVAAIPGDGSSPSAFAGERRSGRIVQVTQGVDPAEFATLQVDASGDGGLTGLALSPTFGEDQLLFAYVTTPSDNRVVRIAKGQPPKPVLTGIPKGPTGNHGALVDDGRDALLVATGDAGNAAAAADPASLAGKVLRIDTSGGPAEGNPTAGSAVLASGLQAPGGLCRSDDGARLWVTDREADKDAVYRVQPGALTVPSWTWPDRPGATGCADFGTGLAVAMAVAGQMQDLPLGSDGSVGGKPVVRLDGTQGPDRKTFGRLAGVDMVNPQLAVVGTANKDGGKPISSDDRVFVLAPDRAAGQSGKD